MLPNPVLDRLGLSEADRVAIIHADDVGMCHATLPAFVDLLDAGLVSSAAAMVPCAWFPEMVALCRQRPDVDVGIHLDATNEYRGYRWGPLSTRDPASGLLDEEGYFHTSPVDLWRNAGPAAVRKEYSVQVERALAAGLDVTHVDSHQLAVFHAGFLADYVQLASHYHLPLMMLRRDAAGWQALGRALGLPIDDDTASQAAMLVAELERQGVPLLDHATMLPLDRPDDRLGQARHAFDALPPGLTHFVLHPACDTAELRAITDDWPSRVADYEVFCSRELRQHVRSRGIHVIGYRALRALL